MVVKVRLSHSRTTLLLLAERDTATYGHRIRADQASRLGEYSCVRLLRRVVERWLQERDLRQNTLQCLSPWTQVR